METSQVQTSPFECVLRNQNHFHKNLKVLVNSCVSDQWRNDKTHRNDERNTTTKNSNNWDKVREIVFSGERKNEDENKTENLPSRSDTSVVEVLHFDSISSLVRRWRDFRVVMKTINSTANNFSVSISKSNSTTSTPCGGSPLMEGLCRHHLAMGNLSPPFHEKNSEALERERLKSPISSRN
nr:Protein neuralized like [Ipomoea batatas]